jgi:hypothetical protein
MQSYFLYGLKDVETVRHTLARLLDQPNATESWTVGIAKAPDAWLRVESAPETWQDNSDIEAGALIIADVSGARAPTSHTVTIAFLRSVQDVLGGVIRDDGDARVG